MTIEELTKQIKVTKKERKKYLEQLATKLCVIEIELNKLDVPKASEYIRWAIDEICDNRTNMFKEE